MHAEMGCDVLNLFIAQECCLRKPGSAAGLVSAEQRRQSFAKTRLAILKGQGVMAASFGPLMLVASVLSSLTPSLEARSSDGAAWLQMLGAVCSGKQQDLVSHPISSPPWAPGGVWRGASGKSCGFLSRMSLLYD